MNQSDFADRDTHMRHAVVEGLLRADDIIAAYDAVNPVLEFWNRVQKFNRIGQSVCCLLLTCHLCIDTRQPSSSTSNTPADDSHKLERVLQGYNNRTHLKLAGGSLVHERATRVPLTCILPSFTPGTHHVVRHRCPGDLTKCGCTGRVTLNK